LRALAIVHQQDAGPGVFLDVFAARGVELDTWPIAADGEPPGDPFRYDAVLTFGGAMHLDQADRHPWLASEQSLLASLLVRGVPLLGVCLGAQLLAAAAGAPVRRACTPEIGWPLVSVSAEGVSDPIFMAWAGRRFEAFAWHSYSFALPAGAVALASSDSCLQAYRVGQRAWGIQFHAEVTLADAESWIADYRSDPDAVRAEVDPARLLADTRARIGAWNDFGRALCGRFLDAAAAATPA
jgi:GMP synthase (glutamine-hydrolysing)